MPKKPENRLLTRAAQKRSHLVTSIYRAATIRERRPDGHILLEEKEKRRRLARELAKLDRREEQRMAEEGLGASTRPPY
jgi:hypothetical protein